MATCHHCGATVSRPFARVFADAAGHVHACPECAATTGIAETARRRRLGLTP